MTTRPRCEAGAYYDEKARIHYACDRKADFQVVVGDDTLLIVWCAEHAKEGGPLLVAGNPRVRMEHWREA